MCLSFSFQGVAYLQPAEVGFVERRHGGIIPKFHGQVLHTDLVGVVVRGVLVLAELAPVAFVSRNKVLGVVYS